MIKEIFCRVCHSKEPVDVALTTDSVGKPMLEGYCPICGSYITYLL